MANVEVTGAAWLYRAASVWTAGLEIFLFVAIVSLPPLKIFGCLAEFPAL